MCEGHGNGLCDLRAACCVLCAAFEVCADVNKALAGRAGCIGATVAAIKAQFNDGGLFGEAVRVLVAVGSGDGWLAAGSCHCACASLQSHVC